MVWIPMAHVMIQWRAVVNTAMDLGFHERIGIFRIAKRLPAFKNSAP